MEVIESNFAVEPLAEEQMFKVALSETHKVTAEELLQQYTGLDNAVTESNKRLGDLDKQKEMAIAQLTRSIEANKPRLDAIQQHLTQAKVWKAIHDKENERRGKEPEAQQPEGGATNETQQVS